MGYTYFKNLRNWLKMNYNSRNFISKAVFAALFILAIGAGMMYYQKTFSMEVIPTIEINNSSLTAKVLIASQGSDYKREVVANVVDAFRESEVYVKVIDVTKLTDIQESDWDVIVLLHTWEMWKPQINAAALMKRTLNKEKLVVLATSGSGEEMMNEVDGITSASVLSNASKDSQEIIQSIKTILKTKYNQSYSSVLEEY